MALLLYLIITWFVLNYFITALDKNHLVVNIILYMIILIATVSLSTIIYLNLGFICFSQDKLKYFAIILNRNIVNPMLLVIFTNILSKSKTYSNKLISIILFLVLNSSTELINLHLGLYTYVKWNFEMHLLIYCIYIFAALKLNNWLLALEKRSE